MVRGLTVFLDLKSLAKRDHAVSFNLEEELRKIGPEYSKAEKLFQVHVIEDVRLITSQNPGSARAVSEVLSRRYKPNEI